jgi:hypothetical protein
MKLACIALVLATASTAVADDNTVLQAQAPQKTIGVDGVAILPLGNYADAVSFGAGAFGRLEIPLATGGFLTGRLGVIAHQVNDNGAMSSLTFVPVFAGYRQPVGAGGIYLAAELGITFGYASVSSGRFGNASASDSELGFTLSIGARRGSLDLRAGLFAPDVDDVHGFMGSVGFDFAAF